jgi:hypothetical protein
MDAVEDLGLNIDPWQVPLYVGMAGERGLKMRLREHALCEVGQASRLIAEITDMLSATSALPPQLPMLIPTIAWPRVAAAFRAWDRYVQGAQKQWVSDHLQVSWLEASDADDARALEASAIRALRPLLNIRSNGTRLEIDRRVEGRVSVDGAKGMGDWEDRRELALTLYTHRGLLEQIGPHTRLEIRCGVDGLVDRNAAPVISEATHPPDARSIWVLGTAFRRPAPAEVGLPSGVDFTWMARPGHLYRTPSRRVFGAPPPWGDIVDALSELDRRSMIALHLLYSNGMLEPAEDGMASLQG